MSKIQRMTKDLKAFVSSLEGTQYVISFGGSQKGVNWSGH